MMLIRFDEEVESTLTYGPFEVAFKRVLIKRGEMKERWKLKMEANLRLVNEK